MFLFTISLVVGCKCHTDENTYIRAIYLTPQDGGQLSIREIEDHQGILMVHSFSDLKEEFQAKYAIWIDKDAIYMIEMEWLHDEPQMYSPLVLIGYNDALYSFREQLTGFEIEGVYVDCSKQSLEPGFSVWILTEKTEKSTSSFMKGYGEAPSVNQIIAVTDMLLEGNLPQ